MKGLITALAVLVALSAFLGWRLVSAHETIGENDRTITAKEAEISRARSQLVAVNLIARLNDSFQAGLQLKQAALSKAKTDRATLVKQVIDETPENTLWAGTPLPADIIRLHKRPTVTGADAYLKYLSESNALRPSGQQPENTR